MRNSGESTPEGIRWASYTSTEDPRENLDYRNYVLPNSYSRVPSVEDRTIGRTYARNRLQSVGQALPDHAEDQLEVLVDHYRRHRPSMPGETEVAHVLALIAAEIAAAREAGIHWIMGSNGWPVLADRDGRERFDALRAGYDSVYLDGEHPLVLLDHTFPASA